MSVTPRYSQPPAIIACSELRVMHIYSPASHPSCSSPHGETGDVIVAKA